MPVPEQLGDFRIAEEIGRGGFGIVYRARQISLDRPVALKVLYRHLIHTQEQIQRFEREARAAARLDHPSVVSVYAWGEDKDDFFIAQKLIGRGTTLADEIVDLRNTSSGPPKGYFREVAERVSCIADALHQAHDRGIVHRDIKPSNILLDDERRPFLGDFGLAKVEDGLDLSRTGDFAGSPFYMSPEQADSRRGAIDARTDIYSLGITLYEALTTKQPFVGNTSHEVIRKILSEEPAPPRKILDRVPADLETICLHAIEKDPRRRYQTALEFSQDLRAFLDGEPISAVPVSTVQRMVRRVRRQSAKVALLVLATILAVGAYWASESTKNLKKDVEVQQEAAARLAELETLREEQRQRIEMEAEADLGDALERGDTVRAAEVSEARKKSLAELQTITAQFTGRVQELVADSDTLNLTNLGKAAQQGGWAGLATELAFGAAGEKKVADDSGDAPPPGLEVPKDDVPTGDVFRIGIFGLEKVPASEQENDTVPE